MCPCDNLFEEGIRAWPRRQNPARGGVSGGNGWKAQKAPRLLAENHALRHLAEWDAGGRRHQHWGRRRCEIWLCHGAVGKRVSVLANVNGLSSYSGPWANDSRTDLALGQ